MNAGPLRIGVVSVHYYEGYLERSLANLRRLNASLQPAACVLVANNPAIVPRLQREVIEPGPVTDAVLHDNTGLEFGAYQAGLARLRTTGDFDWVVILNDTFDIHECFATPLRDNFLRNVLSPVRSTLGIVVGEVDETPRSWLLGGLRTHRWVRSNVLALNAVALDALGDRLHSPELDALIREAAQPDAFFAETLDPVLRERIESWLFPHEADGRWGWYQGQHLNADNAARFARKARCILQEKYLSARLDAASTIFVNIKQLSIADSIRRSLEKRVFHWRHRRGQA